MDNNKRLPCRGCLSSCKNFNRCQGKPWRMSTNTNAEAIAPLQQAKTVNKSVLKP